MTPPQSNKCNPDAMASFAAPTGSAIPDPYAAFFEWCDGNGFQDVGSGPVEDMMPRRFDAAIAAFAARPNEKVSHDAPPS